MRFKFLSFGIIILFLSFSCHRIYDWEIAGNFAKGKYFISQTPPTNWTKTNYDDTNWHTDTSLKDSIPDGKSVFFRLQLSDAIIQENLFLIQMPRHLHFKLYLNGEFFFDHSALQIGTNNPDFWFKDSIPIFDEESPNNFFFYPQSLNFVSGKNLLAIEFPATEFKKFNFSQIAFFTNSFSSQVNASNIPNSKPEGFLKNSNLPIFGINTFGKTIDRKIKSQAVMNVTLPEKGKPESHFIGIEYRGNTSFSFPKKSFSIETRNKKGKNKKVGLLGLPKEKDWVLYGPFADKTLIRNKIIFEISNRLKRYASKTKYIELVINGEYQGIYLLMEKIKKGKNRVNLKRVNNNDKKLFCGYIIAIDKGCKDGWKTKLQKDEKGTKHFFCYKYPEDEKITKQQKDTIQNYIAEFETRLFNHKPIEQFIDLSSFVDYFIINELARNIDAYRLSTYFYLPINGKLTMGPIWDFNYSFGYNNHLDATNPKGWVYEELPNYVPFWWRHLMNYPNFRTLLKNRWTELRETTLSDKNILLLIDKNIKKLGKAKERNFQRWPIIDTKLWMEQEKYDNYSDYVNTMKEWTLKRVKWIDKEIKEF